MGDLTSTSPKPMLSIAGKPILDYKIRNLPGEITEVVLVVGYNHAVVREYFGVTFAGKKITYIHQEVLNGTGAAVHAAQHALQEKFMVIMGDDLYFRDDLTALIRHERALLAYQLDVDGIFGTVKVDAKHRLKDVIERSEAHRGDLVNTGAYMLTKDFFRFPLVSVGNNEFGLPQTMALMAKNLSIEVVLASRWLPVTNPADLSKAERSFHLFYT